MNRHDIGHPNYRLENQQSNNGGAGHMAIDMTRENSRDSNASFATFQSGQTMTEAKHNWRIPKLFGNRLSASATEVFCETIGLVIYIQIYPQNCVFFLATKLKISLA